MLIFSELCTIVKKHSTVSNAARHSNAAQPCPPIFWYIRIHVRIRVNIVVNVSIKNPTWKSTLTSTRVSHKSSCRPSSFSSSNGETRVCNEYSGIGHTKNQNRKYVHWHSTNKNKNKNKNGLKRKEKKFNSGRRRTDLFSFVGLIFEQ